MLSDSFCSPQMPAVGANSVENIVTTYSELSVSAFYENLSASGDVMNVWPDYAIHDHAFRSIKCPYCNSSLDINVLQRTQLVFKKFVVFDGKFDISVESCQKCLWWRIKGKDAEPFEHNGGQEFHLEFSVFGVQYIFDISRIENPTYELNVFLKRNPSLLTDLSPKALERLVADIFRNCMDCEVRHVGQVGDRGIDVLAINGEKVYCIQVKRRSRSDRSEPVSTFRELLGTMVAEGFSHGIVVTTASGPSRYAQSGFLKNELLKRQGYRLECIPFLELINLISLNSTKLQATWDRALKMDYVSLLDEIFETQSATWYSI